MRGVAGLRGCCPSGGGVGHDKNHHRKRRPLNLVSAVQTTKLDLAAEGVIYSDIKCFVNLNFESFSMDVLPNDVMVLVASDIAEPAN
jgi:hypothetical protein